MTIIELIEKLEGYRIHGDDIKVIFIATYGVISEDFTVEYNKIENVVKLEEN